MRDVLKGIHEGAIEIKDEEADGFHTQTHDSEDRRQHPEVRRGSFNRLALAPEP
jgi:hypothetical protein